MQYFDNNNDLKSKKREISISLNDEKYSFISDNGVFSKGEVDYGSIALIKVLLKENLHGLVLDVGCGYGTIGLILAKNFPSCMFTLVMVMMVFSYGICNVSGHITPIFSISFIMIALPIILCIAPVPHPNKPMSEEKSVKLRKRSCILAVTLSVVTIALLVFQYQKLSLYVSSGMLLSAIMALLGHFLNRGDNSKR